jgi:hypothetical protein
MLGSLQAVFERLACGVNLALGREQKNEKEYEQERPAKDDRKD